MSELYRNRVIFSLFVLLYSIIVPLSAQETFSDCPAHLRESVIWVFEQRMSPRSATAPIGENSIGRRNLIFDQIVAARGSLNYVVRWQSSRAVTLQERREINSMIQRQIRLWTDLLIGYDGWPYGQIPVTVVGWAVADASLIQNRQSDEIIYTDWINDPLHNQDSSIPQRLPVAPNTCSRFEHFRTTTYTYSNCPGGAQNRFDMYMWGTQNFRGGAGGDWGQRQGDTYILNNRNNNSVHIILHEMGHGFGLPDFYQAQERPPNGFGDRTIMWAGNSSVITEWDKWMLRYTWSQLKNEQGRFPNLTTPNQPPVVAITSPLNNSSYTAPASVTITASASDPDGSVARVEFFNGTTRLAERTSAPYSYTWNNVAAGTYTITARATDNLGARTTSDPVTVTVNAAPNQPPVISLLTPEDSETFSAPASIIFTSNATDPDGDVVLVEYFSGDTKLGERTNSPYRYTWRDVPAGTYTVTARATDNDGATSVSDAVNITVEAVVSVNNSQINKIQKVSFRNNLLTINNSNLEFPITVSLFDLKGELVYRSSYSESISLDLKKILPAGTFVLLVQKREINLLRRSVNMIQ